MKTGHYQNELISNGANLAINIFTNGTLVTEELAYELSTLNILDIAISIYGATDKTHDNITQKKGSYRKAVQGALILKKHGLNVRFKYIMMNANIGEYEKMLKFSEELNIPYDLDPVITPCDNGDRTPTKFRLDNKSLRNIYKSLTINQKSEIGNPKSQRCSFGRSHCAIGAYGDVYPCIQLPVSAGSIMENSFLEIWNHSAWLKEIRNYSPDKIAGCRKCSLSKYCRRCPGLAYVEDDSLYNPSSEACRHARIVKSVLTP
jgi:radical SAM protein with 4Fe4S-binding SPASM domain